MRTRLTRNQVVFMTAMVAVPVVVHGTVILFVARLIMRTLPHDHSAYMLWMPIGIVDLPITVIHSVLAYYMQGVSDDGHLWNFTIPFWCYLIGGSLQWAGLGWLLGKGLLWFSRPERHAAPGESA